MSKEIGRKLMRKLEVVAFEIDCASDELKDNECDADDIINLSETLSKQYDELISVISDIEDYFYEMEENNDRLVNIKNILDEISY